MSDDYQTRALAIRCRPATGQVPPSHPSRPGDGRRRSAALRQGASRLLETGRRVGAPDRHEHVLHRRLPDQRTKAASSACPGSASSMVPLSIQAWGGTGEKEQRRAWCPALPASGGGPPGWAAGLARARPTKLCCLHAGRGGVHRAKWRKEGVRAKGGGARPAAGQAAQEAGQCQRVGDAQVGRRQGLQRRLLPAETLRRAGRWCAAARARRRRARRVPPGRSGRRRGAPDRAGAPRRGLWARSRAASVSARRASSPSRIALVRRGGARVQPGQCVAGIVERREQHPQVGAPRANRGHRGWVPTRGNNRVGLVGAVPPRADGPRCPRHRKCAPVGHRGIFQVSFSLSHDSRLSRRFWTRSVRHSAFTAGLCGRPGKSGVIRNDHAELAPAASVPAADIPSAAARERTSPWPPILPTDSSAPPRVPATAASRRRTGGGGHAAFCRRRQGPDARAYAADWLIFAAGRPAALPGSCAATSPPAEGGLRASTIGRRAARLCTRTAPLGSTHPAPIAVREVLRGHLRPHARHGSPEQDPGHRRPDFAPPGHQLIGRARPGAHRVRLRRRVPAQRAAAHSSPSA